MTDTKMLQAILSSVAGTNRNIESLRHEMIAGFKELEEKLNNKIDALDEKLTTRIDRLGKQVAYIEDDAPTRQEHDELVQRVSVIEDKISS